MDTPIAADYLRKLLNRALDDNTPIRLTSAQRARFLGWLHERQIVVSEKLISAEFTVSGLFDSATTSAARANGPKAVSKSPGGVGIGIDIQDIDELMTGVSSTDLKSSPEMRAIFTQRELSYAETRPNPNETLAGLFAAKEAIRKCGGEPLASEPDFRLIEILPDENGRPMSEDFHLSISHSRGFAIAVAVPANTTFDSNNSIVSGPTAAPEPVANTTELNRPDTLRLAILASTLLMILMQIVVLGRWIFK